MGTLIALLGGAVVIGGLWWVVLALGPLFWIPLGVLLAWWGLARGWAAFKRDYDRFRNEGVDP